MITANGVTALTEGAGSPGGILSNGGKLTIDGGGVTTTGAGSFGFLVEPATGVASNPPGTLGVSTANAGAANTLTIENATATSAADAFRVTDAVADISVTGSTVAGDNGVLLNTVSSGVTNLTATGSTLTGAILTDITTPSIANVTLNAGTWNMTGSSNMTSLTENGSTVNFSPPAAGADVTALASYKTLTTNTFSGADGEIHMNTFLGDDSSASDRIVINQLATATIPVSLFFTNTGGPGALTAANGIEVVEADERGGTTQPGMFELDNPELRAGAYDYRLFRGSPNGSDPAVANNWFLRSTFLAPPPEPPTGPLAPPEPPPLPLVPPPIPGEPPVTVLPSTPPPEPLPPGVEFPITGPELATYGVVQPLARQLGLSILGTLDDRVGDIYEPDGYAVEPETAPSAALPTKKPGALPTRKPGPALAARPLFSPSVWGRFFGQTINNRYQAFADPHASGNLGGFQGGIDFLRGSLISGHYERMGLYGAYGDVSADVDGLVTNAAATGYVNTHTGSMNLTAWSGGGVLDSYRAGRLVSRHGLAGDQL